MKAILIVTLSFFSVISFGQNAPVDKSEYYAFFNSFINKDSVKKFNLESEPLYNAILGDTALIFKDSIFTAEDIAFINEQLVAAENFTWSDKIAGVKILKTKKLKRYFMHRIRNGWKIYFRRHKEGFFAYSVPYFSIDRTKCIVAKSEHQSYSHDSGGVFVYEKKDNKWIVKKAYIQWISGFD